MKGTPHDYLPQELAFIERWSPFLPRRELYDLFCRFWERDDISFVAFKSLCTRKGWTNGRSGRFETGQEPANKGKKMAYNAASARTQFKKGQRPHTARHVGHESTDKQGYVWLIVGERNPYTGADTRRVQKHKWLWEQANGPVPKHHALKCRDGNKANTDPSNWKLIPKAMLPRLNGRFGRGYDDAPAELKPLIMAVAEVEHAARTAKREAKRGHKDTP